MFLKLNLKPPLEQDLHSIKQHCVYPISLKPTSQEQDKELSTRLTFSGHFVQASSFKGKLHSFIFQEINR